MKRMLFFVLAAFVMILGAAASAPAGTPGSSGLAAQFARPDQTIEYHFMIQAADLTEQELEKTLQAKVIAPMKSIAEIGPLGKPRAGMYVDSRDAILEKNSLIVRVRSGQITLKARAASPDFLLDLEKCSTKKYEMDYFGHPEYSISSDITFKAEELDITPASLTVPALWDFIGKKCPPAYKQIQPVLQRAATAEIPGSARMYGAEVKLVHPLANKAKEAGFTTWFFPPTNRFLVELAYTAYVRDRADTDKMYNEVQAALKAAGLLKADQSSKTQQYFKAYFGK